MQEFTQRLDSYANTKKTNGELEMQLHRAEHELKGFQQVNSELAKQNTLLQDKLQVTNHKMLELQQRNNELAEAYEGKIEELKVLVERKAMELERLSAQVLPKFDQDMLRIKLLNQLELPHRQQLEYQQEQVRKLEVAVQQLEKRVELETSKMAALEGQRHQQLRLLSKNHGQEVERLMRQLSEMVGRQTASKESLRRLKRQNEQLRNKVSSSRRVFDERLEELQSTRHDNANGYKHQMEIGNLKKDVEHARLLLRDAKEENAKLFRQLQKSRDDYSKLAIKWQEQQTLLNEAKQSERTHSERLEAFERQSADMETLQAQLKGLKREAELGKEQAISDSNKIKFLQKELSQAYESLKAPTKGVEQTEAAKATVGIPATRHHSKSVDELHLISELTKAKSQNLQLIERMTAKERELQTAVTELETLKRHAPSAKAGTRSGSPEDSGKVRELRQKLKQANQRIVQLLKEKVSAGRVSPSKNSFYH